MTESETIINNSDENLLRQYLLGELSEAESEALEERFIDDQVIFEQVLALENKLIDSYLLNRLPERELFEKNYLVTPEKQGKVETARALQTYLAGQGAKKSVPEKISGWQKVSEMFAAPSIWQYATVGLLILLTLGGSFLIVDRTRLNNQIAALQSNNPAVSSREEDLNSQLAAARQRENELQNRLREETGQSQSLVNELDNERKTRERLEDEIEKIRRIPKQNSSLAPELATITLRPEPRQGEMTTANPKIPIAIPRNVEALSVKLILPFTAKIENRYLVEFNGLQVASNLAPKVDPSGSKILRFVLSGKNISRNFGVEAALIKVKDLGKNVIADYSVEFKPQ
ncbi:MAG: hypothetical protein ABI954_12265 [Pyrinomonadaceae bacterium]